MKIIKPFYILSVAISLMAGSAFSQTAPIPGKIQQESSSVQSYVDRETGVEYLISTNNSNSAPVITPRLCGWVTSGGQSGMGTIVRIDGIRKCIKNN